MRRLRFLCPGVKGMKHSRGSTLLSRDCLKSAARNVSFVCVCTFKGRTLSGDRLCIARGETLEENAGTLYWRGEAICETGSVNGRRCFARMNGAGQG